jgi:outer membrane protein assembly factor BamB
MAQTATAIINKPSWVELTTPDSEAARAFYSRIFGWQIDVNPDPQYGGYAIAKLGADDAAGIGPKQSPDAPTAWGLYIGTDDGRLAAVDDFGPNQGTVACTLVLGTSTRNLHASPSIGADGTIYLGTDKGLFAVRDDGSRGTVLPGWPFTDQATGDFDTAAAISNGTLFVSRYAQTKRRFYAVAAADSATATPGTKLWSLGPARGSTSTNLAQTPSPVVGANGVVYAAIGRWVYAFDPSVVNPTNVQPLWQFELGADAISLTVGDGVLYVAAKDSKLYALIPQ